MSIFKNKKPVVAIDGTAGSGKGTLAKNLSKIIDFDHLDSGVLYRILACKLLKSGGLINSIVKDLLSLEKFKEMKEEFRLDLRSEEVTDLASKIAKKKKRWDFLISFQRNFADNPPSGNGSVIDGRDITSKIIPSAEVKIYVDADVKIRAKRRVKQMKLNIKSYKKVLESLIERDRNDKLRTESPLIKTFDSFLIDTTKIDEKTVLNIALEIVKEKIDYI